MSPLFSHPPTQPSSPHHPRWQLTRITVLQTYCQNNTHFPVGIVKIFRLDYIPILSRASVCVPYVSVPTQYPPLLFFSGVLPLCLIAAPLRSPISLHDHGHTHLHHLHYYNHSHHISHSHLHSYYYIPATSTHTRTNDNFFIHHHHYYCLYHSLLPLIIATTA